MAEQTTMTTGQRIRKVVEKLDISEIILQVEKRVGNDSLRWIAIRSDNYIDFVLGNKDAMEKAVKILNDLKINKLVSFEIVNEREILASPDPKKYS